jgi:hypothetical protein
MTFESRVCLPPAAHDGVSPLSVAFSGLLCDPIVIDQVDVVTDAACVAAEFVDDITAWSVTGEVTLINNTATIPLRRCERSSISRSFVWPRGSRISMSTRLETDDPATSLFAVKANADIGGASVVLPMGPATTSLCVPPGLADTTAPVSLSTFGNTDCTEGSIGNLFVDDFSVTSDLACDDDPEFADGAFTSSAAGASSWLLSSGSPAHQASVVLQGGNAEVRLRTEAGCLSASASTWALAPNVDGLALRWSTRRPTTLVNSFNFLQVRTATKEEILSLPTSASGPIQQQLCLGDNARGANVEIFFRTGGGSGNCDDVVAFAAEDTIVDDVGFVSDPNCAP